MILAPLAAAALMLSIATGPNAVPNRLSELSVQQKNAATQKFVRSATECIARTVAADPRFRVGADLGDLIVDTMPACLGPVRSMIDVYDQYFGDGIGEAFFMGHISICCPRRSSNGSVTTRSRLWNAQPAYSGSVSSTMSLPTRLVS